MSENLHRFSNHVEAFNSNKVAASWLSLMRDPSRKIRENLACAVGTILKNKITVAKVKQGSTSSDEDPRELVEFVNYLVDFMAETLEIAIDKPDDALHCTLIATAKEFGR